MTASALARRGAWRRRLLQGYVVVVALLAIVWAISLLDPVEEVLREHRWIGFALIIAAVLMSAGAAWLASDRAATPVDQLERMRTDFVANASHELKTPVTGIHLLAESIAQASAVQDNEAVADFSQQLSHESTRLQRLVNDLMDLSRLEDSARAAYGDEACDIAGVVANAIQSRTAKATEKGVTLRFVDEVPDRVCRVRVSAADTALIVENLVANAVAYTEKGEVVARLSTEGGQAVLEVCDTGIGIPPQDQERVFERFYRVDTARSREAGGTGLGLSLVRHAVSRAGGSISLKSELGVGSTFTVRLPLA